MSVDRLAEELARLLDEPGDQLSPHTATDQLGVLAELGEFGELTLLARQLQQLPTALPDPAFRTRLRDTLVAEAAALSPTVVPFPVRVAERVRAWRRSAAVAVAAALSAGTIGTTGIAVAAERTLPGEMLYPVKLGIEDLRLSFASSRLAAGRLHLGFAERRLDEVEAGAQDLPADTLIDTLAAMDDEVLIGSERLLRHYDTTGDQEVLELLEGFVTRQRMRLLAVRDQLPVQVVPFVNRSLEVIRRIDAEGARLTASGCVPCVHGPFDLHAPGEGPPRSRMNCCVGEVPATSTGGQPAPDSQDPVGEGPVPPDETEGDDPFESPPLDLPPTAVPSELPSDPTTLLPSDPTTLLPSDPTTLLPSDPTTLLPSDPLATVGDTADELLDITLGG